MLSHKFTSTTVAHFRHSREFRESRFFFEFSWIPALACILPLGRNDTAVMLTNYGTEH